MNGCESWILKKAECQKIDSFELWCWRRLLKVPWTAKEIKPVNPKGKKTLNIHWKNWFWSLSSNILHHLMWRVDSLGKTLMLGKTEGKRIRRQLKMKWLDNITDSMDVNLGKLWEIVKDGEDCCDAVYDVATSWTWLNDWKKKVNILSMSVFIVFIHAYPSWIWEYSRSSWLQSIVLNHLILISFFGYLLLWASWSAYIQNWLLELQF